MQLGSKRKCVAQDLTDTGHQTGEYIKHRGTIIRANVFSFGSKRVQSKIEVQSKSKDRPPLPAVCMYFVCNWIQRPSASLKISRARGIVQVHTSSKDRDHHKSHITRVRNGARPNTNQYKVQVEVQESKYQEQTDNHQCVCNWIQRASASLKISRAGGIGQVHISA